MHGAFGLQNYTTRIRLLPYDTLADLVDDYLRINASFARYSLQYFVVRVVSHFSDEYLRRHIKKDLTTLFYAVEQRGFWGIMDCMHWWWKNRLIQFKGLYSRRPSKLTLILEVIASYDLWI